MLDDRQDHDPSRLLQPDALGPAIFPALSVSLSVLAVLSLTFPALLGIATGLLLLAMVFILNMVVYYRAAKQISVLIPDLRRLDSVVRIATELTR